MVTTTLEFKAFEKFLVYHTASGHLYKKLIENDDIYKGTN
jgi:hypothetical protein